MTGWVSQIGRQLAQRASERADGGCRGGLEGEGVHRAVSNFMMKQTVGNSPSNERAPVYFPP